MDKPKAVWRRQSQARVLFFSSLLHPEKASSLGLLQASPIPLISKFSLQPPNSHTNPSPDSDYRAPDWDGVKDTRQEANPLKLATLSYSFLNKNSFLLSIIRDPKLHIDSYIWNAWFLLSLLKLSHITQPSKTRANDKNKWSSKFAPLLPSGGRHLPKRPRQKPRQNLWLSLCPPHINRLLPNSFLYVFLESTHLAVLCHLSWRLIQSILKTVLRLHCAKLQQRNTSTVPTPVDNHSMTPHCSQKSAN